MMRHLAYLWEKYPGMVVVSPTMPGCGSRIKDVRDVGRKKGGSGRGVSDGDASLRSMEFVFLGNWVGAPAISAPMGYVLDGGQGGDGVAGVGGGGERQAKRGEGAIPVGIMGMGEWGSEEALMDWAEEGSGLLEEAGRDEEGGGGGGGRAGVRKPAGWEGAWVDVLPKAAAYT